MDEELFGTDGIRGRAGEEPLTFRSLSRLGSVLGWMTVEYPGTFTYPRGQDDPEGVGRILFERHRPLVVICRDPRLSGDMIRSALAGGLTGAGCDVLDAGIVPTPACSVLTSHHEANLGLMITASHNPPGDNGIKLFTPRGFKASEFHEERVEEVFFNEHDYPPAPVEGDRIGRIDEQREEARDIYLEKLASDVSFPGESELSVVLDMANGAVSPVGKAAFEKAGLQVETIHDQPDGERINRNGGAGKLDALRDNVLDSGADIGFGFDGDGDRVILVDEEGNRQDGDVVLATLALDYARRDDLTNRTVVGTKMTNQGLVAFLSEHDIDLVRVDVGDRNIQKKLYDMDGTLGGEQSGHTIQFQKRVTGDGLLTALSLSKLFASSDAPASGTLATFEPFPQVMENITVQEKPHLLDVEPVRKLIGEWNQKLHPEGRVLVRYSGTEPVCRVMAEGRDQENIQTAVDELSKAIRTHIAS